MGMVVLDGISVCATLARAVHRYFCDQDRAPASRQSTRDHRQHHQHLYQQQAAAAVPQLVVVAGVEVVAAQLLQLVGRGGGAAAVPAGSGVCRAFNAPGPYHFAHRPFVFQRTVRGPLSHHSGVSVGVPAACRALCVLLC